MQIFKNLSTLNSFSKKSTAALFTASMFFPSGVMAADQNYSQLHQQLSIMDNILKSSINSAQKASKNGRTRKVSSIESVYLYGQGVVFTISSPTRHRGWGMAPRVPPRAPVSRMPPEMEANFDFDDSVMEMFNEMQPGREITRELRAQQRDLAFEIRDLEREQRDLKYQLKSADEKGKKELNNEIKALEDRKKTFEQHKIALEQRYKTMEVDRKNKRAAHEKNRQAYFNSIATITADTLCLYGNGLKALAKNEHVTVILKNGGDKSERGFSDKLFVFDKKSVSACASNNIKAEKLLANAKKYSF